MKELREEYLIKYLWDAVKVKSLDRKYVEEVASRLSRLEEAEKKLKNRECCGNCINQGKSCYTKCYKHCDNWQPDNLTNEERES